MRLMLIRPSRSSMRRTSRDRKSPCSSARNQTGMIPLQTEDQVVVTVAEILAHPEGTDLQVTRLVTTATSLAILLEIAKREEDLAAEIMSK
jgi:hypothetical protein